TQLASNYKDVMKDGELVWADSAYPINVWIVVPYKKLEQDLPENDAFNTQVSKLHLWSEHAIGFLKGHFHLLKNLHVNICDKNSHILATYWVAACIGLHSFAMQCEEKKR
ncbi:hypothetical protein L208DRAFT_1149788, partial [Tricholoma matsutake]